MALKIHSRHFEISPNLTALIDKQAAKIRKFLPTFASGDIDVTVNMEQLPRGNQYQTILVLSLPQTVIRVEELQDNPTGSAQGAFHELIRRVKRFKSRLNHERLWHRQPPEAAPSPEIDSPPAGEVVFGESLEKVENYVRREIYHKVLAGLIPAGIIDPHALVDEIFVQIKSRQRQAPDGGNVERWIYKLAREHIRDRISELNSHREERHIEELVTPTESELEEEEDFFQPDEALHLEDLIQDRHSASPEELLAREEVAERLQRAIAHLPHELRESFVLFSLEGFTSDEVAMITGKQAAQILAEVETARARLKQEVRS